MQRRGHGRCTCSHTPACRAAAYGRPLPAGHRSLRRRRYRCRIAPSPQRPQRPPRPGSRRSWKSGSRSARPRPSDRFGVAMTCLRFGAGWSRQRRGHLGWLWVVLRHPSDFGRIRRQADDQAAPLGTPPRTHPPFHNHGTLTSVRTLLCAKCAHRCCSIEETPRRCRKRSRLRSPKCTASTSRRPSQNSCTPASGAH